jgi:hypothetical protein
MNNILLCQHNIARWFHTKSVPRSCNRTATGYFDLAYRFYLCTEHKEMHETSMVTPYWPWVPLRVKGDLTKTARKK